MKTKDFIMENSNFYTPSFLSGKHLLMQFWLLLTLLITGINPAYAALDTQIAIETSSRSVLVNDSMLVSGQLISLPNYGNSLRDLLIKTSVELNGTVVKSLSTLTSNIQGSYSQTLGTNVFTQPGHYFISTQFGGAANYNASQSSKIEVVVSAIPGYAIVIQGKTPQGDGLCSHAKSTNRIYQTLLDRGFADKNILYFHFLDSSNPCSFSAPVASAGGSNWNKADIEAALTEWAMSKMNNKPGSLHVVLVGPANQNKLFLDGDVIVPEELSGWFAFLEKGLSNEAKSFERQIVIGSNFSGSFIPALSAPGRSIIASTGASEQAYQGGEEGYKTPVRPAEFFVDLLFQELARGQDWYNAFEHASKEVQVYTRKDPFLLQDPVSSKFDKAMQYPRLDDNADEEGSIVLYEPIDGGKARNRYLGVGNSLEHYHQPYIVGVTENVFLGSADSSATLKLWANSSSFGDAWVEIRHTDTGLKLNGDLLQQEPIVTKIALSGTGTYRSVNTSMFKFPGTYEVFYYIYNAEIDGISPPQKSYVYKFIDGNAAPKNFNLLLPENETLTSTVLAFDWDNAMDPEGDPVTYSLTIALDNQMKDVVHRQKHITRSSTFVDGSAGLEDLTQYFWQVEALDSFGNADQRTLTTQRTFSSVRTFSTNNSSGISGVITGLIFSNIESQAINAASILNSINNISYITEYDGQYIIISPEGTTKLTVSKESYETTAVSGINVVAQETITQNISLPIVSPHTLNITSGPSASPSGTISSGGSVSLSVTATDSSGHLIGYAWTDNSCGGHFSNSKGRTPTWTAPVNTSGSTISCNIRTTVNDGAGGLSKSKSYTQQVSSVAHNLTITSPVSISSGTNPTASSGTVTFTVTAVDSLGHALDYSWTDSGCGEGGSFSSTTARQPTWTAPVNQTGSSMSCNIRVTIWDSTDERSAISTFNQTVTALPHTLTITQPLSTSHNTLPSGESATLQVAATDSYGHTVQYRWVATCPGGDDGTFSSTTSASTQWAAPSILIGSNESCTLQVRISDNTNQLNTNKTKIIQVTHYTNACPVESNAVIGNGTQYTEDVACTGKNNITFGTGVVIQSNVDVVMESNTFVTFGNGFSVKPNARFKVSPSP